MSQLNGAQALLSTLVANDVDVCFTNPGTSEMHFVAALDQQHGMRAVLGLFEGVVTGAADGYARMLDKPACTLLHLGPGLANGLANLHNARRAFSPIVNIVGEHATYHRELDAPLTSNIEGFADPVSGWTKVSTASSDVAADGWSAIAAARQPPGQIATLILPADTAWEAAGEPVKRPISTQSLDAAGDLEAAARALTSDKRCAFLVNGCGARASELEQLGKIAARTGADLLGDTFISRVARGAGRVDLPRLPYFAEQAAETLAAYDYLLLVDTKAPVSFFAYPGKPSSLTPEHCQTIIISERGENTLAALTALVEAVDAAKTPAPVMQRAQPAAPNGALSPDSIAQSVAMLMPEQAIVVNEAATSGFAIPPLTASAAPHDWLDLTGGAIGMGIPVALGAAVACPDRRVLSLQADGSGMYTVQGLWSQARENLDVTTIVFSNRKYAILEVEFMRVGANNPGPKAMNMFSLGNPDLDWVSMAQGMGVSATRVTTANAFHQALAGSIATPGPYLIEAVL